MAKEAAKGAKSKAGTKVIYMKCSADDGDILETAAETLGVTFSSKNVRLVEEDKNEDMIIEERVQAEDADNAVTLVKRLFKKFGVKGTVKIK